MIWKRLKTLWKLSEMRVEKSVQETKYELLPDYTYDKPKNRPATIIDLEAKDPFDEIPAVE